MKFHEVTSLSSNSNQGWCSLSPDHRFSSFQLCAFVRAETTAQVSSLDELIKMFDSSSCKECHEKIYEQWEKSHHARPLMGLDDWILWLPAFKGVAQAGNTAGKERQEPTFPVSSATFPRRNTEPRVAARDRRRILKKTRP